MCCSVHNLCAPPQLHENEQESCILQDLNKKTLDLGNSNRKKKHNEEYE